MKSLFGSITLIIMPLYGAGDIKMNKKNWFVVFVAAVVALAFYSNKGAFVHEYLGTNNECYAISDKQALCYQVGDYVPDYELKRETLTSEWTVGETK